jgi:RNA polymerase sigma factor (sigma-70 family)
MIATLSPQSERARAQWRDPRRRARLIASQLLAAERRRVDRLVRDNLDLLPLAGGHGARLTGLDKDDLTSSAYFGLVHAAETWDPTKGAAFRTWAFFGMRDAVQQEVRRSAGMIRVPRRPASPVPKVTSLDAPRSGNSAETFGALIVDEDAATPLDLAHRADLRERVAAVLGTLRPRDALVIEMRFGINGAAFPHTYVEIAEHLGVCTQRARQIERRALDELRDALASFDE